MNVSCHRSSFPGPSLEPAVIPTAQAPQASHCSTFRIMCDVPSIAVFCNESIKCFPVTASKFFLKLLVTLLLLLLLLLLFTAIELSLGGSSPYSSTDKQIRINIHKRNNTKIQYKE